MSAVLFERYNRTNIRYDTLLHGSMVDENVWVPS